MRRIVWILVLVSLSLSGRAAQRYHLEGGQYRLADFTWSGNTLVSSADLSRYITLKPGEPANAPKLAYDLAQARKLFLKFGREAAAITPVPTFTGETVSYVFNVKGRRSLPHGPV
jgi:outer membrane protein assembly factor BamA